MEAPSQQASMREHEIWKGGACIHFWNVWNPIPAGLICVRFHLFETNVVGNEWDAWQQIGDLSLDLSFIAIDS